ncbi:hypothetical protein EYF80_035595 [Liparis tanakae]|uniref:Uncharacterized protein n=1 Tax=Liparis tanakae TaxID=230148 RepID=A0A4Z2GKV5_9TELE|nr:hypothetical protein EYF80_035595 [Liparis tanakae]
MRENRVITLFYAPWPSWWLLTTVTTNTITTITTNTITTTTNTTVTTNTITTNTTITTGAERCIVGDRSSGLTGAPPVGSAPCDSQPSEWRPSDAPR